MQTCLIRREEDSVVHIGFGHCVISYCTVCEIVLLFVSIFVFVLICQILLVFVLTVTPQMVVSRSHNSTVEAGTTVTFSCSVRGEISGGVMWLSPNVRNSAGLPLFNNSGFEIDSSVRKLYRVVWL